MKGRLASAVLAGSLLALLSLPILALPLSLRLAHFRAAWEHGLGPALALSLATSTVSAIILAILGTPLAWWMGRSTSRAARWAEAWVRLPAVTPPAVAGIALLGAFGRRTVIGSALAAIGIGLPFSSAAVVIAQIFVSAPFYVLAAAEAFRELDPELLLVSRTLGAGPGRTFFAVALPLARSGLISALAVAWARALGEFGATLVFAGNLRGVTQTLPLAIYTAMESDLGPARALAVVLLALALGLFVALRFIARRR